MEDCAGCGGTRDARAAAAHPIKACPSCLAPLSQRDTNAHLAAALEAADDDGVDSYPCPTDIHGDDAIEILCTECGCRFVARVESAAPADPAASQPDFDDTADDDLL